MMETTTIPRVEPSDRDTADTTHRDDPESLRFYTKAKLALVAQVRALRELLKQRGSETRLRQCDELMVKLAEDRFTLAVLGQFKRGKSSLMNALIGRALLPVGVLPLTSAITLLRFGPKERLLVTREDVTLPFPDEYPVERLAEFVTEKENPGNRKRLKCACVELPSPFLRRGLEFVDTPGVGSAIEANTATTLRFLPDCDAALFVTSVETPFTKVELEFLERIRAHVRKIFFVVNKTDLLDGHERQEVLDFITRTIRGQMGSADVKVFPLSSRIGLTAKLAGDWTACLQSGLKNFEDALARFLSGEKASVFLTAILDKALRLLEQESVEVELQRKARATADADLSRELETLGARWREHETVRTKTFDRLRQHIAAQTAVALTPEFQIFLTRERTRLSRHLEGVLRRAAWQPCREVSARLAGRALGLLRQNTLRWALEHAELLTFRSDQVALEHWKQIQSNLNEIPLLAAGVLGVEQGKSSVDETLPPWHVDVVFETPVLPHLQWNPGVTGGWALLPVRFRRERLRLKMEEEYDRLMKHFAGLALAFFTLHVNKALDRLADAVRSQANETQTRLLAAFAGKRPPGTGASTDGELGQSEPEWAGAQLQSMREHILALRAEIACAHWTPTEDPVEQPAPPREPIAPTALMMSFGVPTREGDLLSDLETRGCPACEHLARTAFEFFAQWQYALVTDEHAQKAFAAELGFCPLHLWQLAAVSSPLGASVGWVKLAERLSQAVTQAATSPSASQDVPALVRRSTNCRICRLLRDAERKYVQRLAAAVQEPRGRETYARSQGACLRHIGLLLGALASEEARQFLLRHAARRFEEMAEDMQSYGMKTEALRCALQNADEMDAYRRALNHLAGAKAVCCPWDEDGEL
jgi:predicted GTPase